MKIITKNTDYAIRALVNLAINNDRPVSVREISEQEGIPFQYLRRILNTLVKERMVSSKEGSNGGLTLIRDPKEMSLIDIIEIFQGKLELSECMFRDKICPNRKTCVLNKRIRGIESQVVDNFKKITVYSLVKDSN